MKIKTKGGVYLLSLISITVLACMVGFMPVQADMPKVVQITHTEAYNNAEFDPCELDVVTCEDELWEVSYYSEIDSCHNPVEGGCLTASGKIAEVGMVASNMFEFGTRLLIDGVEYTVEDRTSTRYSNRIDIFTGYSEKAYQIALSNGIDYLKVIVL